MLPEGIIISGLVGGVLSKIINDGTDYSKSTIKKVLNDKNNRNLSTKIYCVIERVLNVVTHKKYKDSDILFDAIEKIFIEFKDNGNTLESVKCGLGLLCSDISDQICDNFLEKFYEEIRKDDDLYKAINMILQEKGIKISQEEFQRLNEKIDNLTEIVNISNRNDYEIDLQDREPVKSRTQEYADKWNQNMFLNDYDEWDENVGVNVKLKDVYLEEHLPHFIWRRNNKESDTLKKLLSEYINEYQGKKMLLILGQPGIGKSTLITWITANFMDRRDNILIYQFAADLKSIDWDNICDNHDIADIILKELDLSYDILNGKTLIIDGFDEISIERDRSEILNRFYWQLIKRSKTNNFSVIITCRENYIKKPYNFSCAYITLQPWDDKQIRSFCMIYSQKVKNKITTSTITYVSNNREILGIPLILYMVLALNISLEKEGSIVDVYDKIFLLNGGVYDRCINNDSYASPHWIKEIKRQIHQISRDIAIWMFENNPDEASIPQKEYEKICTNVMQEHIQKERNNRQDFLVGTYFKLVKHCEGIETEKLYFVHRSIYEYFVAETIFTSMDEVIDTPKERLARAFGMLLKRNRLSTEILSFLKIKIKKSRLDSALDNVNETFQMMLKDGMTYYTSKCYKEVLECEMNVFANMLELVHLWEIDSIKIDNIYKYLKYNKKLNLNLKGVIFSTGKDAVSGGIPDLLKGVYLEGVYLRKANLAEANLVGAYLKCADLREAYLDGINLGKADLTEANLRGATLTKAILIGATLTKADLREADLTEASIEDIYLEGAVIDDSQVSIFEKKYNLQDVKIFINKTQEIINYNEYCKRKK